MTDEPDAVTTDDVVITGPEEQEEIPHDDGRPVSDGPGQHHPNADTTHSAVPNAKRTHEF